MNHKPRPGSDVALLALPRVDAMRAPSGGRRPGRTRRGQTKLGLRNRTEIAVWAWEHRIVETT